MSKQQKQHKTLISSLLGLFFLALLFVGAWYIVELQSTITGLHSQVEEVGSDFEVLLGKFEATQNAHGVAVLEIDDLALKLEQLERLVLEQDRILQDMALQVSYQ